MKKIIIFFVVSSLFIANIAHATEDKYFYDQNWLLAIGWSDFIKNISVGTNAVVAVIDEGVWQEHPDLQGSIWLNTKEIPQNGKDDDSNGYVDDYYGWNFIDNNSDMTTKGSHGTQIAGIIAAKHDAIGIAGIAPESKIMSLIACNKYGCNRAAVIKAIRYAVDNGVNIINLSLSASGYLGYTSEYDSAIKYAYDKNVIIVASAGNGDTESAGQINQIGQNLNYIKASPVSNDVENINMVVGVGASQNGVPISWSNYGGSVDVWAPGSKVLTTTVPAYGSGYGYKEVSGTSFSAPMVSAAAALIKSAYPNLKNWEIVDYIKTNDYLDINKIFKTSRPQCRIDSTQQKTINLGESFIINGAHIAASFKPVLIKNGEQYSKTSLLQHFKNLDATKIEINTSGMNIPSGTYSIASDSSSDCSVGYNSLEITNNSPVISTVKTILEPENKNSIESSVQFTTPKINVNVRLKPEITSKIVSIAKANIKYEIIDFTAEWLKIKLPGGKVGWSMTKYLNVQKENNK
ncbi:MAG: S8 family serine peptidase, partial [Patescibacteria group bacterium]